MTTTNINGLHDGTIFVTTSNNIYNIGANARLLNTPTVYPISAAILDDPSISPAPGHNIFNIDGTVLGGSSGLYLSGDQDEVHVGGTGRIVAGHGIDMMGDSGLVTNAGEIIALDGPAIAGTSCTGLVIRNTGNLSGDSGILLEDVGNGTVVNGATGDIVSLDMGVYFHSKMGETSRFINHGTVTATGMMGAAFYGTFGDEVVVNDGLLHGSVSLGDGNDRIDNRGGRITGEIWGGYDDDVLITDKATDKLEEISGEGNDTVKSTVSYRLTDSVENLFLLGTADINGTGTMWEDRLHGNAGDNLLKGLAGADHLWGGKGRDIMKGGFDADVFHFVTGDGHDTISDFVQGSDLVDVSGWAGLNDFADVLSHAHDSGTDVVITVGADTLLIRDTTKAELTAADFTFPI